MRVAGNMALLATSCLEVQRGKVVDSQDFTIATTNVAGNRLDTREMRSSLFNAKFALNAYYSPLRLTVILLRKHSNSD